MKQFFGYSLLVGLIAICFLGAYNFAYQDDQTGVLIAGGFGVFFLLLLIYAIGYEVRKVRIRQVVLEDYAEIMTDVYQIEKLAEDHYYIHTHWIDPIGGAEYFFKSEYILFNPQHLVKGRKIPVKISQIDYKKYFVDLSFLPKKG